MNHFGAQNMVKLVLSIRARIPSMETLRRRFEGWVSGSSIYVYGLMLSYIVFVSVFGPLYSVRNLILLFSMSVADAFPLISFLSRFFIISCFAMPLGFSFMTLRRGKEKGRTWKMFVSALLLAVCGLGAAKSVGDKSTVLTLIFFTSFLLLAIMTRDDTPYKKGNSYKKFFSTLVMFHSVYTIVFFMLFSLNFDFTNYGELMGFLRTFLNIQVLSLPLALVTTPIVLGVEHKQKPSVIWVSFISSTLLFIFMSYLKFYAEAVFFILLSILVFYCYAQEKLEFIEYPVKEKNLFNRLFKPEVHGQEEFYNSLRVLAKQAASFVELKKLELTRPPDSRLHEGDSFLLDRIVRPLEAIAREAELFREVKTGEVLKVRKMNGYLPSLKRMVNVKGIMKDAGVKHYLISSRTGHGKTTLIKNLMNRCEEFAFLVIDRHSEYSTPSIILDEVLDVTALERILKQLPGIGLTADRSILREAQVFSLEQQFDRVLDDILPKELVNETAQSLFQGQNVIIKPGKIPHLIYNRIINNVVAQIFDEKMQSGEKQPIAIVNEEAQNSFEVTEDGQERNRTHPLLKVILEGRKYNVSLINITSDPDHIPKPVKDNSILILGSIGTPAIKRMVGEKLGMIYIRYIYELPIGYFFMDEPDIDGRYIVFPNHFGEVPSVLAS